jgi:glycosyltransferase involved in cell wall biosynthesis
VRVLIDYRPALRERSGVGEYTHRLVTSLLSCYPPSSANGALELTIFSSSWKDRLRRTPELDGAAAVDRRVPVSLLNFAWHRLEWPSAEALTGRRFDVTHSLHPLLLPSRRAAQVIMIHDLDFLAHPERTRAEVRRDYPELARDHAARADRIIVPSPFTAREVERQLGIAGERIAICPPGRPDWTPRKGLPGNGYILFFGTLEPRKNVAGLLDAYERLIADAGRHVRSGDARSDGRMIPELVLAGKATGEARPWLERLTRAPLAGRVRHIGYVEPRDRQALYAGAHMLVMPSFDEGFGMPVLEAMTLGVPVVASSRGALPDVLGDAGPLVDPDDPVALGGAIARLLDDDAYAGACAAKGVLRASHFSWDRTARLVYAAYVQAVEARKPRARPR